MSNKTGKITVDVFITIFAILSFVRWEGATGFIFHAIVGSVFALLAIVHIALNRQWIAGVTKQLLAGKANKKAKPLYITSMILIAIWGIAIASGFLAIPWFVNGRETFYPFSRIHAVSSRIGAVFILVHIYQHLGHIRSYMGINKKPEKQPP
ncbi:MAG: hypothetical protein FWG66_08425 [Spirochaetes bacterium]|nr:hypothetical protein [Spirochaetota bacterium]